MVNAASQRTECRESTEAESAVDYENIKKERFTCTSSATTETQTPTLNPCGIHYPISKEAHSEAQIFQRIVLTATTTSRLSGRSKATMPEECYASGSIRLIGDRTSDLGTFDGCKRTS